MASPSLQARRISALFLFMAASKTDTWDVFSGSIVLTSVFFMTKLCPPSKLQFVPASCAVAWLFNNWGEALCHTYVDVLLSVTVSPVFKFFSLTVNRHSKQVCKSLFGNSYLEVVFSFFISPTPMMYPKIVHSPEELDNILILGALFWRVLPNCLVKFCTDYSS